MTDPTPSATPAVRPEYEDRLRRAHASALQRIRQDWRAQLRPADVLSDEILVPQAICRWSPERDKADATPDRKLFTALVARESPAPGTPLAVRADLTRPRTSREFWAEVFAESNKTMEDLAPYRIRVAWRWARETARLMGLLQEDELLCEALIPYRTADDAVVDPWEAPAGPAQPRGHTKDARHRGRVGDVVELMSPDAQSGRPGLTILPPEVPLEWLDEAIVREYDPADEKDDPELHRWLEAFERVVDYLGIENGSQKEPRSGTYGLYGLRQPRYTRLCFPSRYEIMAYEECILDETLNVLVRSGFRGAQRYLTKAYGLTLREIESMIQLARREAKRRTAGDVVEDRAIMVLRLEQFIAEARAKNPLDTKTPLLAMKQLAIVQGLAKAEIQDEMSQILNVMRDVASQPNKSLPGPAITDAEIIDVG